MERKGGLGTCFGVVNRNGGWFLGRGRWESWVVAQRGRWDGGSDESEYWCVAVPIVSSNSWHSREVFVFVFRHVVEARKPMSVVASRPK